MAKEIAISKRAKISEAQQYVLLSVLGASIFLGAAIALTLHFVKVIQFNIGVIAAEEASIASYSAVRVLKGQYITVKNLKIATQVVLILRIFQALCVPTFLKVWLLTKLLAPSLKKTTLPVSTH